MGVGQVRGDRRRVGREASRVGPAAPDHRDQGVVAMSERARVWLITGCSSGFGRHLALAALAAGDRVMATARHPEQLTDLVAAGGDRVRTTSLDVTDTATVDRAVAATVDAF